MPLKTTFFVKLYYGNKKTWQLGLFTTYTRGRAGLSCHFIFFCIQYTVFWGCAIFFYPKRIMMIVLFHVNCQHFLSHWLWCFHTFDDTLVYLAWFFLYLWGGFIVFQWRCTSISVVTFLYLWGVYDVHFCCRWIVDISLSCISWVIF